MKVPGRAVSGVYVRIVRRVVAALAVLSLAGLPTAAGQALSEYDLKAAFLFNFAQFVDWPATAFAEPTAPFVIGVLGDDPFGDALDATVAGQRLYGRPFVIRRYRSVDEIDACHILFVSRSEAGRLDAVTTALAGRNILTVSDTEGFAGAGGMITLVTVNNRIRLRINVDAASSGMLTISSKLLRPAEIVTTRRG